MATDLFIHEYKPLKLERSMVVIGFPSIGLVSSIAANFIVKQMRLEKVAAIVSNEFPPYSIIHEGSVVPPMRIHAGARTCDEKGENCETLVVITSEFMPEPNLLRPLVDLIIDWGRKNEANTIVTLEGVNMGENPEQRDILAVATGERCKKMLATYGMKEFKEGMVSGLSGVMLSEGDRLDQDVICLLGPARTDFPDARGAARLLEQLAKMLPELKLDPEPLFKEAETVEKELRSNLEKMKLASRKTDESLLYG
ncbi:MAG TPA: PAC2 family protein [Methanomassiliicoccales archaeon]|nr:PAC2 family protein [Methanomassiliicoccales archaeon]